MFEGPISAVQKKKNHSKHSNYQFGVKTEELVVDMQMCVKNKYIYIKYII